MPRPACQNGRPANLVPNKKYFYGMIFALAYAVPNAMKNTHFCVKFSLQRFLDFSLEGADILCIMTA
jgi:hypothetical protein